MANEMTRTRPISDYEIWLRDTSGDMIGLFVSDNGKIVDQIEGLPASSPLEHVALCLEQSFATWHFDKRGDPEPWLTCSPCGDRSGGNATLVLLHARDFCETMTGEEALAKAFKTLGRVDLRSGPPGTRP